MSPPDDSVTLVIDERQFAYWDDLEIHLGLDSHASVGFTAPFEPERSAFRSTFEPFSFKPITLQVGGELLFTGNMVDVTPRLEPSRRQVAVSAYSRPAVLDECSASVESLPLECNGLSLVQIAQHLCKPYGIAAVTASSAATERPRNLVAVRAAGESQAAFEARKKQTDKKARTTFDRVKPQDGQHVGELLADLARQLGLVTCSTAKGELLFLESVKAGSPVAKLVEGRQPLIEVVPTFSPRDYYNEITGFTTAKRGRQGSKYTERLNRLAGGALRATNMKLDDIDAADAPNAVRAAAARMLGNMVTYVVSVPTWRDPHDHLWNPNTTIVLDAPSAMIYGQYEFLIRDVYLKQNANEKTASLGLVLPGAFSGEAPGHLPWKPPLVSEDFAREPPLA